MKFKGWSPLDEFDTVLKYQNINSKDYDCNMALNILLIKYREDILDVLRFADCFESFHKAFRQTDVTVDGQMDTIIWHLLHQSSLFRVIWDDPESWGNEDNVEELVEEKSTTQQTKKRRKKRAEKNKLGNV